MSRIVLRIDRRRCDIPTPRGITTPSWNYYPLVALRPPRDSATPNTFHWHTGTYAGTLPVLKYAHARIPINKDRHSEIMRRR